MPSTREPETALEYWLRAALRERYDEAVAEPVPEWLTRLVTPYRFAGAASDRRRP